MQNTVKSALVVAAAAAAVLSAAGAASAQDYPPTVTDPGTGSTTEVLGTVITRPGVADPSSTSSLGGTVQGTAAQGDVASGSTAGTGGLAYTGADVLGVGVGGGALVLVGAGALLAARKRRS